MFLLRKNKQEKNIQLEVHMRDKLTSNLQLYIITKTQYFGCEKCVS